MTSTFLGCHAPLSASRSHGATLDLQLLGSHLAVPGKSPARIGAMVTDPLAQNDDVEIQVAERLRHRHAAIPDRFTAASLNSRLNLRRCIHTLRFQNTLTRCPRNRQQLTQYTPHSVWMRGYLVGPWAQLSPFFQGKQGFGLVPAVLEGVLAERVGFEPTVSLHPQRFSRPSRSTTLAPLRGRVGAHGRPGRRAAYRQRGEVCQALSRAKIAGDFATVNFSLYVYWTGDTARFA